MNNVLRYNNPIKQAQLRAFATAYCEFTAGEKKVDVVDKHSKHSSPHSGSPVDSAAKAMNISTSIAYKWIQHPVVIAEIKRRVEAAMVRHGRTADELLDEVCALGYTRMGDFFERKPDGSLVLKDIDKMGDADKAIRKVKQKVVERGEGEDKVVETFYEYEMWDKLEALKILAQFHRIIGERSDMGGRPRITLVLPDNSGPVLEDRSKEIEADFTEIGSEDSFNEKCPENIEK